MSAVYTDERTAIIKRGIAKTPEGEWPYRVPILLQGSQGDHAEVMASVPAESNVEPGKKCTAVKMRGEWFVVGVVK